LTILLIVAATIIVIAVSDDLIVDIISVFVGLMFVMVVKDLRA